MAVYVSEGDQSTCIMERDEGNFGKGLIKSEEICRLSGLKS